MVAKPTKIHPPITATVQTVSHKQEARAQEPLKQDGVKIETRAINCIQLRLFRRDIIQTVNRAFKFGRLTTVKQIIHKTDLILETKKKHIVEQLEKKAVNYPKLRPLLYLIKQTTPNTIEGANAHKKTLKMPCTILKKMKHYLMR